MGNDQLENKLKARMDKELETFYSSSEFVKLPNGKFLRKRWLPPTKVEIRWRERHMGCNTNNCFTLALVCGLVSGAISLGVQVLMGNIVATMATNFLLYLVFCFNSIRLMEMWDSKALKHQLKNGESKHISPHLRETCMENFFMYETMFLIATSLAILMWLVR